MFFWSLNNFRKTLWRFPLPILIMLSHHYKIFFLINLNCFNLLKITSTPTSLEFLGLEGLDSSCCTSIYELFVFLNIFNIQKIKNMFLMYLRYLQHFQHRLKKIQISNYFWTRSTFNTSFLKFLIFLIETALMLPF